MSRPATGWLLTVATLVIGIAPAPVVAQQAEEELIRHIDSLMPLLEQAEAEAAEAKRRRMEAERLASASVTDTFMVGPVRIVTVPEQRTLAEEVFRAIWDREYARFIESSPSMEDHPFTFMWSQTLQTIYVEEPVQRIEMRAWRPRTAIEEGIRHGVSSVLGLDLSGTRLSAWSSGVVRVPREPEELYRDLALSPSMAAQACLEGDTASCWIALGLGTEGDDYPLDEWYSPEERRAIVGRIGPSRQQTPLWSACVEGGSTSSCDRFLDEFVQRVYRDPSPLAPLQPASRAAMLWIALQMGGEGAWDRLREDPQATADAALLHASGATRDELAHAWRSYVLDHKPTSRAGMGVSILLALLWVGVFGALAMRSTRWRMG